MNGMNSEPDAEIIASEDKKQNMQYKNFIAQQAEGVELPPANNVFKTMQATPFGNS